MKALKKQLLADRLRAHAYAMERTGFQSNHERQMAADMRAAAAALSPKSVVVLPPIQRSGGGAS